MPAQPRPQTKAQKDQQVKTWTIIGFISVAVLVGGFFALKVLMEEDRGGRKLLNEQQAPASQPVKKVVAEEPVALVAKPIRVFDDLLRAIHRNDKKAVLAISEMDEAKIDLLVNDEMAKIATEALQSKRIEREEPRIDGLNADLAATLQNGRGYKVIKIRALMRQRSSAEDWVINRIETQWFAASGKQAESRTIELGANRATAAHDIEVHSTMGTMPEDEPRVLDWLPGTGEAQKAEIERHIRDLFDDKNPAKLSTASSALVTIGKNSIPKLLSEFVPLDVRSEEDVKKGNAIDRTLAAMTDLEMGYDPASFQSAGALPPAQARARAVRRWFGWWKVNKDQPLPRRNQPEEK